MLTMLTQLSQMVLGSSLPFKFLVCYFSLLLSEVVTKIWQTTTRLSSLLQDLQEHDNLDPTLIQILLSPTLTSKLHLHQHLMAVAVVGAVVEVMVMVKQATIRMCLWLGQVHNHTLWQSMTHQLLHRQLVKLVHVIHCHLIQHTANKIALLDLLLLRVRISVTFLKIRRHQEGLHLPPS
jgi:hypothetical protein